MRVIVLIGSLLLWPNALAHWVAFTPCGMEPTDEVEHGYERFIVPSPNLSVLYVWAPAVLAVVSYTTRSLGDGAVCSTVLLPGRFIHVQGDAEAVIGWLQKEDQTSE